MTMLETLANTFAVLTFVWLTYRLTLLIFSLPIRCREAQALSATISRIVQFIAANGSEPNVSNWRYKTNEEFEFLGVLRDVAAFARRGFPDLPAVRVQHWLEQVAGDWERHASIPVLATSWGMTYTVAGGLFAFGHIGQSGSEDPFAAFGSLSLAMLTTIAGLAIAMAAATVLRHYQYQLATVERATECCVLELQKSILLATPDQATITETLSSTDPTATGQQQYEVPTNPANSTAPEFWSAESPDVRPAVALQGTAQPTPPAQPLLPTATPHPAATAKEDFWNGTQPNGQATKAPSGVSFAETGKHKTSEGQEKNENG